MARPRQYQPEPGRWPPCARCGDCYMTAARWPEGPVCTYCYNKAKHRRGACAACPHEGVLPGLDAAGAPICRSCSGIDVPLDCRRCGAEDTLYRAGTCQRCALGDDLTALLAGPDGALTPELARLHAALTGMPEPRSGIAWLRMNPKVPALLRSLGFGELALTHEALDGLPASRTLDYLRGLLIEHDLLPRATPVSPATAPGSRTSSPASPTPTSGSWSSGSAAGTTCAGCVTRAAKTRSAGSARTRSCGPSSQPRWRSPSWAGSPTAAALLATAPNTTSTPGSPAGPAPAVTPACSSTGPATSGCSRG